LTATPAGDSNFIGWTGDCGGSDDCVLVMTGTKNAIATFDLIPPPAYTWASFPSTFGASLKTTVGDIFTDLKIPIVLIIVLPIAFWFISKVVATIKDSLSSKNS
jgi:hypothetical protein